MDTHAKRISNLMGFSKEKEPEKIGQDLLKLIPKNYLQSVNHLLFGMVEIPVLPENPNVNLVRLKIIVNFTKN